MGQRQFMRGDGHDRLSVKNRLVLAGFDRRTGIGELATYEDLGHRLIGNAQPAPHAHRHDRLLRIIAGQIVIGETGQAYTGYFMWQ